MPLSPKEEKELLLLLERREMIERPSPFEDEWDFLTRACFTKDEATGSIRQFPDKPYLKKLTELRKGCNIFALEKSRRMMATWWLLCLYLYDTLTQNNHANFIGSRKLESSAYLLGDERIYGVYERIPASVWKYKPTLIRRGKHENGYKMLHCPETGSFITAIASGAEQLRQYTASNIFADEFAFWDKAEESWGAMLPCADGGGHVDIISTPEIGAFMYDLIYD